ncbi:asparagine synthase (glutamine-hydrolyzing) [Halobellus captivus]|uniref:asparagine synthase (glutamine-hydrolyzing) n=1 Tax=Halobellus captivus TaxID=2592614 RepID=UPI0011A7B86B|nr:asparagine synthase (glutamine-hydrolyzing) [Halobellus captivus]
MCGICGAAGIVDEAILDEMASSQRHRGPESTGSHVDNDVMLSNQRLRVIDVGGGDQPIYNEDGDITVVYNGEIYNFQPLRRALESVGHTFTTATDTEVLVHGYEEWGEEVFERLNGMFAVALWDASTERLILARDRTGIKPLHVAYVDGCVLFASEPKAILRSGLVEPAVDTDALQYFLQLRYSPSHTTLFDGIETIQPGTYAVIERSGEAWQVDENRYWDLSMAVSDPPPNPAVAVQSALRNAVRRQLVSDVPVGFYLSGGLDTSSVVAMADELTDDPIHTFCMGFEDQIWDEREDARAIADHFGTQHHELQIDGEFIEDFPEMIWHADEPKRNLYPYYVAEEMRNHVTVALGGLGADELFGGYVYRFNRLQELEDLQHSAIAASAGTPSKHAVQVASAQTETGEVTNDDLLQDQGGTARTIDTLSQNAEQIAMTQIENGDLSNDDLLEDLETTSHVDDPTTLYVLLNSSDVLGDLDFYRKRAFGRELQDNFQTTEVIERNHPHDDHTLKLREQGLRWDFCVKLPNDFLFVEDRMSMAHSLESRVPFLDNEMINVAFSLPLSEKFDTTRGDVDIGKTVLRDAMRSKLPATVFEKDKQGFTMPTYQFAKGQLLPHAKAILDDAHIVHQGFIDEKYLRDLLHRTPTSDLVPHYKLLWKIVAFEIWYQMYIVESVAGPASIGNYYT